MPPALIKYAVFIVLGAFLAMTRCSSRDKILSSMLWPYGRRLTKRNRRRVGSKLDGANLSSYHGVIFKHEKRKLQKRFDWQIVESVLSQLPFPDFL